jgi:hypothetical protein
MDLDQAHERLRAAIGEVLKEATATEQWDLLVWLWQETDNLQRALMREMLDKSKAGSTPFGLE